MVISVVRDGTTYYLHTAWAEDPDGTGFSLTEFDDALCVGTYQDTSPDESTDPGRYNWDEIDYGTPDADDETDTAVDIDSVVDDIGADIDDMDDALSEVDAKTRITENNLENTQNTTDLGLGNINELAGTNKGDAGWAVPDGFIVETIRESLDPDNPDADVLDITRITCIDAGMGMASFEADDLAAQLGEDSMDDGYTLSFESRVSRLFEVSPIAVQNEDGEGVQIEFEPMDNSREDIEGGDETTEATDVIVGAGEWVGYQSTAQPTGEAYVAQSLYFGLFQMQPGDTLDIVNLKIEKGALATPWRPSLSEVQAQVAEVRTIAESAREAVWLTNQHFYHDNMGAHVTTSDGGDNVLLNSEGLYVRNGEEALAFFRKDGSTIGSTSEGMHLAQSPTDLEMRSGDFHDIQVMYMGSHDNIQTLNGLTETHAVGKIEMPSGEFDYVWRGSLLYPYYGYIILRKLEILTETDEVVNTYTPAITQVPGRHDRWELDGLHYDDSTHEWSLYQTDELGNETGTLGAIANWIEQSSATQGKAKLRFTYDSIGLSPWFTFGSRASQQAGSYPGRLSLTQGGGNIANGEASVAIGIANKALGDFSLAMGRGAEAPENGDVSLGKYNLTAPKNSDGWDYASPKGTGDVSPIWFRYGDGFNTGMRHNTLEIDQAGRININAENPGVYVKGRPLIDIDHTTSSMGTDWIAVWHGLESRGGDGLYLMDLYAMHNATVDLKVWTSFVYYYDIQFSTSDEWSSIKQQLGITGILGVDMGATSTDTVFMTSPTPDARSARIITFVPRNSGKSENVTVYAHWLCAYNPWTTKAWNNR
ncbi:MAG: hypothetical protein ACOX4I_00630 [Anaerovoracaceae bacterium]|jgi:hypothetical protein